MLTNNAVEKYDTKNQVYIDLIHNAALQGSSSGIIFFTTQYPALLNEKNSAGYTALHLACQGFLSELNKPKADKISLEERYGDVIKTLIEAGAAIDCRDNEGNTPLHYTLEKLRSVVIAKLFLHYGERTCFTQLNNKGDNLLHMIIKDKTNICDLIRLLLKESVTDTKLLIEKENQAGLCPLFALGSKLSHEELKEDEFLQAMFLLIDSVTTISMIKDTRLTSLLHLAVKYEQDNLVKKVCERIKQDHKDKGAIYAINKPDYDGNTPLHLAVMYFIDMPTSSKAKIITTLIDYGADIFKENYDLKTPYGLLKEMPSSTISAMALDSCDKKKVTLGSIGRKNSMASESHGIAQIIQAVKPKRSLNYEGLNQELKDSLTHHVLFKKYYDKLKYCHDTLKSEDVLENWHEYEWLYNKYKDAYACIIDPGFDYTSEYHPEAFTLTIDAIIEDIRQVERSIIELDEIRRTQRGSYNEWLDTISLFYRQVTMCAYDIRKVNYFSAYLTPHYHHQDHGLKIHEKVIDEHCETTEWFRYERTSYQYSLKTLETLVHHLQKHGHGEQYSSDIANVIDYIKKARKDITPMQHSKELCNYRKYYHKYHEDTLNWLLETSNDLSSSKDSTVSPSSSCTTLSTATSPGYLTCDLNDINSVDQDESSETMSISQRSSNSQEQDVIATPSSNTREWKPSSWQNKMQFFKENLKDKIKTKDEKEKEPSNKKGPKKK